MRLGFVKYPFNYHQPDQTNYRIARPEVGVSFDNAPVCHYVKHVKGLSVTYISQLWCSNRPMKPGYEEIAVWTGANIAAANCRCAVGQAIRIGNQLGANG